MKNVLDGDMQKVSERDGYGSKHEYSVGGCLTRVNHAMKWRKDAGYDDKWAKIIKLYANQYEYTELSGYTDIVAPNMMFSTANVIIPSVMVNYPKITVTARRPEVEQNGQVVEAVVNYFWQHRDFQEEMKLIVKDFVLLGHGIGKITWLLGEEEVELSRDEWTAAVSQALMDANMARQQAEAAGVDVTFPSDEEIIASVPTSKTVITEDCPDLGRISPFDLYVDPDATRFKKARWVAQRMYIPLEEARDNQDWDAKARKKLKGTAMSSAKKDYDLTFAGEQRGSEADFVIVWEYYDLLEEKVCVFADGCDLFLLKPEDFEYPFGHPFVFLQNYEVPEKLYPLGDLESILPLQMELALTRTQMVNDRKRFRRMYMYKPDEIGADGLAALMSSDDNAMIPVDSDSPFSDVLAPVVTTSLPPEFYNQTAMILEDMDRTTAVTEYDRGGASEIRRTATEAAMIQDGANARSADKLAKVELAVGEVAQRCVQLCQEFLSTDQVAKIVGPDGSLMWVPFNQDTVQGEFDFVVEAGSTQPQNESFRRQSAMQLLDAMAPFISAGVVDPSKLAEHVLRNGFGIKDPGSFLMPPPDMMGGMPSQGGGMPVGDSAVPVGPPPM
jgi:hypothetical protein